MPINKNEITKEMFEKAMQCQTAEELITLAKEKGIDITKEEAEAYLDELSEYELEDGELKYVAGGGFWDKLRKVPNKVAKSATDYN